MSHSIYYLDMTLLFATVMSVLAGLLMSALAKWLPERIVEEEQAYISELKGMPAPHLSQFSITAYFKHNHWRSRDTAVIIFGAVATCLLSLMIYGETPRGYLLVGVCWVMVLLAVIDMHTQLLPDVLSQPLLWIGFLAQISPVTQTISLEQSLLGAVGAYGLLWAVSTIFTLIRKKQGLGHGDVKLLGVFGAWMGFSGALVALCIGAFLGLIWQLGVGLRHPNQFTQPFAFGQWLVLGALVALFTKLY